MKASKKKSNKGTKRPATLASAASAAKSQPATPKPRPDAAGHENAQPTQAGQPRVYSYTRFSSSEQEDGDSERRQLAAAQNYAKERGMVLDNKLQMIDRGVSGFRGAHRKGGAFGEFLKLVTDELVPRGSILLVENIDRLGREPVLTAIETVIDLLKHGISIVTLSPADTYNTESVKGGRFYALISHIERAHSESERKSHLLQESWNERRRIASKDQMLTSQIPAWLHADVIKTKTGRVVSRKVSVIPKAKETILRIFNLKLDGFGKSAIERKLNESASWRPVNGWRASYIEKILRSPAVIGEFQPHRIERDKEGKRLRVPDGEAIPNYYDEIVPPNLFYAVQKKMAGNNGSGGRTGKATNVFQNLVKCAYCGGSMVFIDKGNSSKGGQYLVCDNGRRLLKDDDGKPKCGKHSIRYNEFEETLLDNLSKLRPENILPNRNEAAEQAKQLRDSIAGLTGQVADAESKIENLINQIEASGDGNIRARYEKRIASLGAEQVEANAERMRQEAILQNLERNAQTFHDWQKNLNGLKQAIAKDADTRIRLKTHLKEFVERVEIFASGHEKMVEHAEAMLEESELEQTKSYPAFQRYLRKRLLSPDGRFFKLHLRCGQAMPLVNRVDEKGRKYTNAREIARAKGSGIEIAPSDSLAASVSIKPEGWKFSAPNLDKLSKEFFDARKPGRFVPKASVL